MVFIKANSHCPATHDKTLLSVLCPLRWYELDSQQLKTVADRTRSLNTFRAIVQFTPAHQTQQRQDHFVVSGVAVWIESARPPTSVFSVEVWRATKCEHRTHTHTPTQNALFWRSSCTRHDKTLTPACRLPPRPRPGRQLCLAACWQTAHKQRRCKPRSFL